MYINTDLTTQHTIQVRPWVGFGFENETQNISSIMGTTVSPEQYNFSTCAFSFGAYISCSDAVTFSNQAVAANGSFLSPELETFETNVNVNNAEQTSDR